MRRAAHWLWGHSWKLLSAVYNRPTQNSLLTPYSEAQKMEQWGFTEISFGCDCGGIKTHRLIGDHSGIKSHAELIELERMMR